MFLCSLPQFQGLEQPLTPRRCLIHLFILTVLGLHCCAGLFSRCEDQRLLCSCCAWDGLLIPAASLVVETGLQGARLQ